MKSGTDPSGAAERLRVLMAEAENVVSGAAGLSWPDHQRQYLLWIERAEVELYNLFEDPSTWLALYSEHHWQLRNMTNPKLRPFTLLRSEIGFQVSRLAAIRESLLRLAALLSAADGVFAVLDTHVLLHYLPPDQVDWFKVVRRAPVRLVVPLRVVEEVDEKKYTARDDGTAARARGVITRLRELVLREAGAPVRLREDVTIEVPLAHDRRRRTGDADEEVLGTCLLLKAAGGDVVLVTGDAGLAIRAAARKVPTVEMPSCYARRRLRETSDVGSHPQVDEAR